MERRQMNQSELARAAGISHKSVSYYLNRGSIPKHSVLQALGDALNIPRGDIFAAAGRGERQGSFRLPESRVMDAETLTPEQSELVYEIIRHLAEGNRQRMYREYGTSTQPPQIPYRAEHDREDVTGNDNPAPITAAEDTSANPEDYDLAAFEPDEREHGIEPDDVGDDAP